MKRDQMKQLLLGLLLAFSLTLLLGACPERFSAWFEAGPALASDDVPVNNVAPENVASDVPSAVLQAEAERVAVIDQAKNSVLAIFSASGQGGGSGVVISSDGYALTNFHVAKPCGAAMKCGMADGKVYDAVIVGIDPTGDVALIKLFGRDDFPHAEMGDSDLVRVGDWVFVMGNPFLLATDFQPTVTYGIVSGVHRYQYPAGTLLEYADCIQTDASINPGNSGGPLFDAQGRLIGINGRGSFEKRGRVNVGVGYAISLGQINHFLGYLHSGRIVDHATLGARVGFDEDGRVVVIDILDDSDAYRRGLRYDDEIVRFGGRPIHTPNGFKNVLGIYPKGFRVPLSFRRDGRRHDILVRLAGMHRQGELIEKAQGRFQQPPMPIPKGPDDKPGRDEDQPSKGPRPKESPQPIPMPEDSPPPGPKGGRLGTLRGIPPMPQIVKEHFEKKRGCANYYFNRLHRDRVYQAWTALGDSTASPGTWTLEGPLAGGDARFRIELTDDGATLDLPDGSFPWRADDERHDLTAPPGSGGLLAAWYFWRRLAVDGPGRYGDVHYLGTMPDPEHNRPVDVLVGIHLGVECRFLFDPDDGHLVAMEMFPEENVDPCEIRFSEYRQTDGRFLPGRMEVRFGDDVYTIFTIDQFEFQP